MPRGKPFEKGHKALPGAGRPKGMLVGKLADAVRAFLSEEKDGRTKLDNILGAMYEKANEGDPQAARVLLDRGFGQPVATTELITKTNGEETTLGQWLKDIGGPIATKQKAG